MFRFLLPSLFLVFTLVACDKNSPLPMSIEPDRTVSWPSDGWQTTTPEREGLDPQAIAQLDAEFRAGEHGYVDSMLIIRDGRLAFEAYYENDYQAINADLVTGESGPWNYYDYTWHPNYMGSDLHTMQSSSKSFMSALVGIAIARGDLSGTDAMLGELLPHRNITDPQKAAITLENILTMTPGFEWEEDISYLDPKNDATQSELTDDWVGYLLDKPLIHEQGTSYKYNSANTQMMSEMVSTATGKALNEYAEELLFDPIGIKDYFWKDAPEGFKDVSGGIFLQPRDLARFALLYERDGEWDGQQVVPADWVAISAIPHVADTAPSSPDFNVGYGYQWWIYNHGEGDQPFMYGTWGWGGQFALIVPELDLIGVFTGWNIYEGQDYDYAFELFYDRVVLSAISATDNNR